MAYTFISRLIPSSKHKLKAPYSMTPQYICIHNTYNDASASNEIAYMTNNTSVTGYHVAIDDKQIIQAIPFNRNAFHAGDGATGDGNRKSIGIEICYSKSGGSRYYEAEANTVEYVAHLLKQYGWDVDRIKWHLDFSGKNCPHRMIAEGRLDSFKQNVKKRLDELNGKTVTASTVPTTPAQPKPQTPTPTIQNKEGKYLKLSTWQNDEMAVIFKMAREKGVFSSVEHEENVKAGTMTYDQAIFLMTLIAGASLNGGKRVK